MKYVLTERMDINGSMNVTDLEEKTDMPSSKTKSVAGKKSDPAIAKGIQSYSYAQNSSVPEGTDLSGGYILEIMCGHYGECGFKTKQGMYVNIKSPAYPTQEMVQYIAAYVQDFENALFSDTGYNSEGKHWTEYADVKSYAAQTLIYTFYLNWEIYRTSTYMTKDAGGILKFGPVWDFDTAYGLFEADYSPEAPVAGYTTFGKALLAIPDFRQGVGEEEAVLHSLIRDILLSTDPNVKGERLRSLAGYDAEVAGSRQMDLALWPITANTHKTQRTVDDLRAILDRRETWLHNNMDSYTRFQDVKKSDWFAPSVEEAVGKGLFQGVSASFFAPNDSMTRGMVTTVLYRMAGQPAVSAYASPFTDVAPDQWYAPAVTWAAATGVVTGYPDGTFQPNAPVTRQELVALMHRYALSKGAGQAAGDLPATFADRDQVPDWARGDFAWAVEQSLVAGSAGSDGALFLAPQGQATRAQGAALFLRLSQFLETLPPAEEAPGPVEPAPAEQTPPAETPPAEQTPPAETTPAETPAETGTQTAP